MTVTATDTEGAAATQTFAVTVPNRAPVVTEALPARTIEVGEAATVDMSSFFSDPDGDDLAYAVVTGDAALAVAEVSGSVIMVTAVAKGSVSVTVTATDPEGGATAQSFEVTVPNRAPVAKGAVEAQTTEVGEAATVDMSPFFSDPDGDALVYTVETSDAALATAEVSGSVVSVIAIARGSASVKVTATDTEGASATQDFEVTVPNRVPVAVGEIPAQTVEVGHEVSLEMGPFFTDPDGDALVYAVAPDNATVAEGSAGELAVTVAALAKGNATMTVTATDIEGASATQSFSVMVPNRPPAITGEIPTQTVEVGEERTMDLSSYFTDPDGDPLAHAVEATDAAVVTASVAEGAVVLAALAKGEATVTVTVTDNEGLTAMQAFPVTVPNRAPITEGAVEPQTIEVGETAAVDASSHFSDPDGDELSYTFTIPDVAVATIEPTGHLAVLTAKAKGKATATVTATDAEGLTATMAFAVTVPNQAPVAMGSIAAQTVYRDSVIEVKVASAFTDPDGDALVYTVASFNPAVVEATATDGVVTVSTISQGEATVTVQATDGEGLADSAGFLVTVPNRGPFVPGRFSRYRLEPDDTLTLGTAQYFADPDGDPLDVEAESSDERVATAAIENESLVLVAVRRGAAKVTVTATDPWGLEVEQEFRVSVVRPGDGGGGNKPPTVTGTISPRTVTSGEQFRMGIDGYFHDPDGDALAFFASSADEDNAVAEVTGSTLTVTGAGAGTVDVTVTAVDPGSLSAEMTFPVTVEEYTGGNRSPSVTQVIEPQPLQPDASFETSLGEHFRDPDNDPLTFSAQSSNEGVATAEVSDAGDLSLTAVSEGTTTISVTATDPGELQTRIDFRATVRDAANNSAPQIKGTPLPDTMRYETRYHRYNYPVIDGVDHFEDPEGDPLTFTATSSNRQAVRVDQSGSKTIIKDWFDFGESTITITAKDPVGASISQSFVYVVTNTPPFLSSQGLAFTEWSITTGLADTIPINAFFGNADIIRGDHPLRFEAGSSDPAKVAASLIISPHSGTDRHLELHGIASGQATVTLTAFDNAGNSIPMSFTVTVDGNRRPTIKKRFPSPPTLSWGDTLSYTLTEYFEDPDGDQLTYSEHVDLSDTEEKELIESAIVFSGDTVHFVAPVVDVATFSWSWVSIAATDPDGKSVSSRNFMVILVLAPPDTTTSDTTDSGGDSEPQQLVLSSPASRWTTGPTVEFAPGPFQPTRRPTRRLRKEGLHGLR